MICEITVILNWKLKPHQHLANDESCCSLHGGPSAALCQAQSEHSAALCQAQSEHSAGLPTTFTNRQIISMASSAVVHFLHLILSFIPSQNFIFIHNFSPTLIYFRLPSFFTHFFLIF
jgi:hypothetical protein